MANRSISRGAPYTLQSAATTGNGLAVAIPANFQNHNVSVEGSGTITGGTISIEEADTPDYTGDWSVITTINGTDVTSDAIKVTHVAGLVRALRARISSDITGGGNVTVEVTSW